MNDLQLTISDFKSFDGEVITLKNLTVLAGINSAGKSTIIQALLLLRVTIEQDRLFLQNADKIKIPLNGPYNMELGNTFEVIRRSKRVSDSTMRLALEEVGGVKYADVLYVGDRATQTNYELVTEDFEILGDPPTGLMHECFYYLCAERIGPRLKYEYEVLPYQHVGYKGEHTFQILSGENIEIMAPRTINRESFGLLFDVVREWLEYIIPGSKFNSATAMGRSRVIEGTFAESLPTNVGFGISYVLPIIVNCLIAKEDTVVIIENPEAHLHPFGQSRIGLFLAQMADCGLRIIIETHSDHVINGIRLSTLREIIPSQNVIVNFVSKKEQEGIHIDEINISNLGDLSDYPSGFFDQEQQDIANMIMEKRKKLG